MTIFFVLNGLGVVFLLYVLVNFWKDGRRPKTAPRQYATEFLRKDGADVLVVTDPISCNACGGVSVIPMQIRGRGQRSNQGDRRFVDETDEILIEMPIEIPMKTKRFSTR